MASLRRFPGSPYLFANFTGPDGRRRSVSTKETDERRARRIADQYEYAAKQGRAGLLVERQARKVIADIYQIANRETLRSETISAYFTGWLERKQREVTPATFTRYSGIVTEFLSWLGGRAALGVAHLSSACLAYMALFQWHNGDITASQATIEEAISLERELNDMHGLAGKLEIAAFLACEERNLMKVELYSSELIELSTRHRFAYWMATGVIYRGWALSAAGKTAEGILSIEQPAPSNLASEALSPGTST
jgi:hypothetical protein